MQNPVTNTAVACADAYVVSPSALSRVSVDASSDNSVLESVTRWLGSAPLTDLERDSIVAGTQDAAMKMAAYKHMLAIRRAGRVTKNQGWLDYVQDRLLSREVLEPVQTNAYAWIAIGEFLLKMQESDTKFIDSVTKSQEDAVLAAARQAAAPKPPAPPSAAVLGDIPPHQRERLRKLIQSAVLKLAEPKNPESGS